MKISTKGRYGLRALVDLASHYEKGHVSLSQIAERQCISLNYLEQVFAKLRRVGILKSVKGAQGGYQLIRHPREISVCEVLEALEGDFNIIDPDATIELPIEKAIDKLVWTPINKQVFELAHGMSVEELIEDKNYILD